VLARAFARAMDEAAALEIVEEARRHCVSIEFADPGTYGKSVPEASTLHEKAPAKRGSFLRPAVAAPRPADSSNRHYAQLPVLHGLAAAW
jgi:hypothetical protein